MDDMPNVDSILERIRRGEGLSGEEAEKGKKRIEDDLAETLRRVKIRFESDIRTLYRFMMDPKAPTAAKGVAIGALLYFVLPIDVIPDFIPVIGYADDAAVIAAAVAYLSKELAAYRNDTKPARPARAATSTKARNA